MALFSVPNVKIEGISAAVPKEKFSNWDYDKLTEAERRMLIKTTGVETKRIAPLGLTTSDLCFAAAEKLIEELQWRKEDIQVLVFLSQSPDYYLPATAIILQDRLNLPKSCMAFDIGLGCSGFPYGLSIISSLLSTTGLKKGLLVMGDVSSATCSYDDKSTFPLFGDAGTVTAVSFDDSAVPFSFNLNSDGSGYEAIMIKDGGIRNLISEASLSKVKVSEGIERSSLNLALNGLDVFNFSISRVPEAVREFYDFTHSSERDYDFFIMHQANLLMNETIRKKLKFDSSKVPYSIREYGNTSSASIPLTIVTELGDLVKREKASLLCTGFGVGLSWGVVSIHLDKIVCPPLIEI